MAINVLDEYRLTERRTVMYPRAPVRVSTRSYLEVEGTVHLFFRSVRDGGGGCGDNKMTSSLVFTGGGGVDSENNNITHPPIAGWRRGGGGMLQ